MPYSTRAEEVARDLFAELYAAPQPIGAPPAAIHFHLDSTDIVLTVEEATEWVKPSVDAGFPEVRYYLEWRDALVALVNLAAFEEPDYQPYV